MTKAQEKQYAARGYRPNNTANSEEYEAAILDGTGNANKRTDFPKWKYHAIEMPVIVKDENEENDYAGWSDSPVIATEDDLIEETHEERAKRPYNRKAVAA